MFSIAITTFNRHDMIGAALINIIDNQFVDEIIISDDCSDDFKDLERVVTALSKIYDKPIKLYKNSRNMGSFWNKCIAVEYCEPGAQVVLFDSDNVMCRDSLSVLRLVQPANNEILCPEIAWPNFDYRHLLKDIGKTEGAHMNKEFVQKFIGEDKLLHFMNTGNFCFNREFFLDAVKNMKHHFDCSASCSIYLNFLFLRSGGILRIVPGWKYFHRIHDGSYWIQNDVKAIAAAKRIIEEIRKMK